MRCDVVADAWRKDGVQACLSKGSDIDIEFVIYRPAVLLSF